MDPERMGGSDGRVAGQQGSGPQYAILAPGTGGRAGRDAGVAGDQDGLGQLISHWMPNLSTRVPK